MKAYYIALIPGIVSLFSPSQTEGLMILLVLILVLADLLTGISASIKQKVPITSNKLQGTSNKILGYFGLYLVVKATAFVALSLLGGETVGSALCSIVLGFSVLREAGSVLENVQKLGVPLPKRLLKVMGRLEDEMDSELDEDRPTDIQR